jgi:hypothetical protein
MMDSKTTTTMRVKFSFLGTREKNERKKRKGHP